MRVHAVPSSHMLRKPKYLTGNADLIVLAWKASGPFVSSTVVRWPKWDLLASGEWHGGMPPKLSLEWYWGLCWLHLCTSVCKECASSSWWNVFKFIINQEQNTSFTLAIFLLISWGEWAHFSYHPEYHKTWKILPLSNAYNQYTYKVASGSCSFRSRVFPCKQMLNRIWKARWTYMGVLVK